ncbi:malate synthase, glyoxysomal [Iris pallida]|uniref:Malate synthase, glyoxysomal n=1 Tax=Iris pallida TaxID=29817 RepID=A0AAX6FH90_IRIPA|nr:malate synthase, glyoxysomal [Iris pallida]
MASKTCFYDVPEGVEVRGRYDEEFATVLTRDALRFVAGLEREFRGQVRRAMELRHEARGRWDAGGAPGFDPATEPVREGEWACAAVPRPSRTGGWRSRGRPGGRWSSMLSTPELRSSW